MKKLKIFLALPLFLFLFSQTAFATISQFVFVTSPQTIPIDTLSDIVTIQSQDSSGTKENIANTMYVTVTSSSATGQLFSNTTDGVLAVPVTMSKNSANKNFYYKDSTPGTHTLHVEVTDIKGNPPLFSVDQNITVGGSDSGATNTNATTTSSTTGDATSEEVFSVSGSAHSSPAPLGDTEQKMEFEISGGRDRLTTVGNTVLFRAVAIKTQNVAEQNITYGWSFGDGTTVQGNTPSHSYRFPGEYVVVVNGFYSDKQAVSRLQVKVVSPHVLLERVSGGLQITNKSGVEINLEGWSLVGGKKSFVFPTDTLIPNNKKVIFANEVTGMEGDVVQLQNPMHQEIVRVNAETTSISDISTPASLQDLQAKLDEAKTKLAQISPKLAPTPKVVRVISEQKTEPLVLVPEETGTENTAIVFEAPVQTGIVTTIFSLPMRGFNFIKHLFIEE